MCRSAVRSVHAADIDLATTVRLPPTSRRDSCRLLACQTPAMTLRSAIRQTLALLVVTLSIFLSRTLWMTIGGLYVVWIVHWSDVATLYTLDNAAQLQAFTQLALCRYGLIGSIVLGYLGFTKGSTGVAGYVLDKLNPKDS